MSSNLTSDTLLTIKFFRLCHLFQRKLNTAAELATSADNLLKVFKNTVSGLSGVITKAREQAAIKQQEADAALAEKKALEEVAEKNETTLNKLTDLLG